MMTKPAKQTTKQTTKPEKQFRLTKKQKAYADKYLETGNATQSALGVYNTTDYDTAANIGYENLKKPQIKAYLDDKGDMAGSIIEELALKGEKEETRLNASKYIYDQVHGKATQKTEIGGFDGAPLIIKWKN